jgi:uncharacterized RDD family membrane protein YckC
LKTEEGVYYPKEAYAGFLLRLMVELIDIVLASALCFLFAIGLVVGPFRIEPFTPLFGDVLLTGWIFIWFAYFVPLKGSRLNTLGYRIGKIRIVNLQGNPPSLYSLTLRLMFAIIGPLNILLDLIWLTSDPNRQALRDKFAHTYVIKRDAQVAGRGKIVYQRFSIFGWNLLFPEVVTGGDKQNQPASGLVNRF